VAGPGPTPSHHAQDRRRPEEAEGKGDGPIAAAFDAVNHLVGWPVELEDLTIRAATPGGTRWERSSCGRGSPGKTFTGRGASTDVVDAAVRAYLHALNKAAHARTTRPKPSRRLRAEGRLIP
jgi:hypothetical protein